MLYLHSESIITMNKPQKVYLVYDYWISYDDNKVYAIVLKDNILYFIESELK